MRKLINVLFGTFKIYLALTILSIVIWIPINVTYSADGSFVIGLPLPFYITTSAKCEDCNDNFNELYFLIDLVFCYGIYLLKSAFINWKNKKS